MKYLSSIGVAIESSRKRFSNFVAISLTFSSFVMGSSCFLQISLNLATERIPFITSSSPTYFLALE
uniref:Uncharacterized protein n=1 Tax=Amphimedon queenslandica TaxID=400682 RepID=A0A1X7U7Z0_AMPQE